MNKPERCRLLTRRFSRGPGAAWGGAPVPVPVPFPFDGADYVSVALSHDREDFYTVFRSRSFEIMKRLVLTPR
jgi:hypothetical protein